MRHRDWYSIHPTTNQPNDMTNEDQDIYYLPDPDLDGPDAAWKAEGSTAEWEAAIYSMMWFRYNHSVEDAMRLAYGDDVYEDPDRCAYAKIKEKNWQQCPLSFYARLDSSNRFAFTDGLRRVYEKQARAQVRPELEVRDAN